MGKGNDFRKLLAENEYIVLPGAYDSLSAHIVENLGFKAVDISGSGVSYARLGEPDLGLATMTEIVDQCQNIANSVDIPIVADADTGYGGVVNAVRTALALEKAGVAAMHMEDQEMPKRCGNLTGKVLVDVKDMCAKISAAKEAVDDFFIIARCDGRALGMEEVKRRLYAYLEAGADMAMLGDDYPVPELREIVGEFRGNLYLVTSIYPGEEMCLPAEEYAEMGVKCISYPTVAISAAAKGITDIYSHLKETNHMSIEHLAENTIHIRDMEKIVNQEKWIDIENRYKY